ncbi:LysE/ArgO family amino acid transporter [Pullulanibacillus sp. KACC 23026]|uniref:LysE/ArgO family amino acid transporter n=1 Tax=Pullulanibacillus sp. KACC 23026 TaxID=3028315 RepID=UPI0023AFB939|nr:LysE/ArgO family amino acid transporter [Pullulanibacillus sp. KACC 23026]WEG15033.1 LysE/ArgO family amino acid transporter [Pullulanibacillus sp. KACC 23026]
MIEAFIHGFILAIGLILPLGAQNVFVFNQGASQATFVRALPAVITAGLCDTVLILVEVFGLSVIVFEIPWLTVGIYLVGFVFLVFMGWRIWRDASKQNTEVESVSLWKQVSFALSASLLNPHALLDTIGVIGTGSLIYHGSAKWSYLVACVLVSWLWFFFLAILGKLLKGLDKEGRVIRLLNKVSALIILLVAVYFGWMILHALRVV